MGYRRRLFILWPFSFFVIIYFLLFKFNLERNFSISDDMENFSGYSDAHFYFLDNYLPKLKFTASGVVERGKIIDITDVNGNGKDFSFSSRDGRLSEEGLFVGTGVRVNLEDLEILASGGEFKETGYSFSNALSTIDLDSQKIVIQGDNLRINPMLKTFVYNGNISGEVERRKKFEYGIKFKTNTLKLNENNQLTMNEAVEIVWKDMLLTAADGEVYLDNYYTDLAYFMLTGDVKFKEGVTSGMAERVEGRNDDKRIILTGYPRVFQNENSIRGSKITVRSNNMLIEVDDVRADVLLEDK